MEQKLLFIDSDPYLPAQLEQALEGAKMGLDWVDNAIKACAMMQRESYAMIVMEMELPYLHGLDALPIINQLNPNLPVIIYTSFKFYQKHEETRLASDYILKKGRSLRPIVQAILGVSTASTSFPILPRAQYSPPGQPGIFS